MYSFAAATDSTGDESSATGNTDIIVPVLSAAMVVAVIIAITVVIVALRWRKHKKVAIKILKVILCAHFRTIIQLKAPFNILL